MTAHIEAQRTDHGVPVAVACRALGVAVSWFYKHWGRPPSAAEERRAARDAKITSSFDANDGEYGSPRIHAELVDDGERVGMNTVAKRMSALGLVGKKRRRRRSLTKADPAAPKFANLLERKFNPPAPNVAFVGDITEIKTWEGKLYLATVIDLYSRRLIGWAIADHCKAPLVCDALKMAIATRGGQVVGVIMHTDRGSQLGFKELSQHCPVGRSVGVRRGPRRVFATLKTELVYRSVLASKALAHRRLVAWFDRYNRTRRHGHCGLVAPIAYETATVPAARAAWG